MAKGHCNWEPRVPRDLSSTEEWSALFRRLQSELNNNRGEAKKIYLKTKDPDFIRDFGPLLIEHPTQTDYTYESLLRETDLAEHIGNKNVITNLENEYGFRKKGEPVIFNDRSVAINKMQAFNNIPSYRGKFFARVAQRSSDGKWGVYIAPASKLLAIEVQKETYNEDLNNRLSGILNEVGISTDVLIDLEKRLGYKGVADMDLARTAGETIVSAIRTANGTNLDPAYAEEAVHIMIASTKHLPLTQRLINNIKTNNLARNILGDNYDTYAEEYSNDLSSLAEEAAGKLVVEWLQKDNSFGVNKSFLQRVWSEIKNWFRNNLIDKDVRNAMISANNTARDYASIILTGEIKDKIKLSNISTSRKFLSVESSVNKNQDLLKRLIENTEKKLSIYGNEKTTRFNDKQKEILTKALEDYEAAQFEEGIFNVLNTTLSELKSLETRLDKINEDVTSTPQEKATVLRNIDNFTNSFGFLLRDLRTQLREDAKSENPKFNPETTIILNEVELFVSNIRADFARVAAPVVMDIVRPILSENMLKYITEEQLYDMLFVADRDISFASRWLDSMASTRDTWGQLIDKQVKIAKDQARRLSDIDIKNLQEAQIKLEKSGIKNTEWLAEKGVDGLPTGYAIENIYWPKFYKDKEDFDKYILDKYGENVEDPKLLKEKKKEIRNWIEKTFEKKNGVRRPRLSLYENKEYTNLSQAQKEYYDFFIDQLSKTYGYISHKNLPNRMLLPQVRKDLLERIKKSSSLQEIGEQVWRNAAETFVRTTEDTDFGSRAVENKKDVVVETDFSGNEHKFLPTFFTRKLGNMKDLSLDLTASLSAFTLMAHEHRSLYKILDGLELTRLLLSQRDVLSTRGGRPVYERSQDGKNERRVVKDKTKVNITSRIDDFFDHHVYGIAKKDAGSVNMFGVDVDLSKTVDLINKWTSITTMGGNSLIALSNIATGSFMMMEEIVAKEYYTSGLKNIFNADRKYNTYLPSFMAEIGKRTKSNKLSLFDEKFNFMQDYSGNIRGMNMDRKTRFGQVFGLNLLYFQQHAGEFWLQMRNGLAIMDTVTLVDENGRKFKLYDAYDVVKSNGVGRLKLKDGLKKEDGTAWTQEDEYKLERKAIALNERMHGIYNKTDTNAFQRTAIGRLGFLFRGWIIQPLKRRYQGANFNQDLDNYEEGFYRTAGKYFLNYAKSLKNGQFNIAANWKELSNHEKANMRRFFTEVAMLFTLSTLFQVMFGGDDEEPDTLAMSMLKYQLLRLNTETRVYSPTPWMISEGLRMLQSPIAGINLIEDVMGVLRLAVPTEWFGDGMWHKEIERGRYKGRTQAERAILNAIPLNNTIYKSFNPDELIPFYQN